METYSKFTHFVAMLTSTFRKYYTTLFVRLLGTQIYLVIISFVIIYFVSHASVNMKYTFQFIETSIEFCIKIENIIELLKMIM